MDNAGSFFHLYFDWWSEAAGGRGVQVRKWLSPRLVCALCSPLGGRRLAKPSAYHCRVVNYNEEHARLIQNNASAIPYFGAMSIWVED